MRSFFISFKAGGKGIDIWGDLVADMPDGAKLDKPFIDGIKADIKSSFDAKFDQAPLTSESPTISQVVIFSIIPLEA